MDTRNGTGGYSTPQPAGARTYQALGQAGIPSSGVSAVSVSVTVVSPTTDGALTLSASNTPPEWSGGVVVTWRVGETVSASTLSGVGSDGKVQVYSSASVNILVDVQGYFDVGNGTPAPGGYAPVTPSRIVDTTSGLGAPAGKVVTGGSVTVQAGGMGGVPANASAVFVNITVSGQAGSGYITPYQTGATRPITSLDFPAGRNVAFGNSVPLSSAGQFTIYVAAGGPLNVMVDVLGYFAATTSTQVFTSAQTRLLDTRTANVPLAANSVTSFQVAGLNTIPPAGTGVAAVPIVFQVLPVSPNPGGYLTVWRGDQSEPTGTSSVNFATTDVRSNLVVPAVAPDGTIKVANHSSGQVHLVLDADGWFATPNSLPQASGAHCVASGSRTGSQPLQHQLTDRASLTINPTNGNLLVSGTLLHLRGVGQDVSVSWRYNGVNDTRPTLSTGLFEAALQPWNDGSYSYVAPDGGCYKFVKIGTKWLVPPGLNATLTSAVAGTVKIRFNPSGITNTYTLTSGVYRLTSSVDKSVSNPNTVAYIYTGNLLTKITDTQGRAVTFGYTDPNNPTQPSMITDTSLGRSIALVYGGPSGALSKTTDAAGDTLNFGYDATGLTSITDGLGHKTTFSYDVLNRVIFWTYGVGTTSAAAWDASYPSPTQTNVEDADNHTVTYTLAGTTVTKIVDPLGHATGSSWDGQNNLLSRTDAINNITSYTYGTGAGNPNNMLSKITSPAGQTGGTGTSVSLSYPTTATGGLSDYQPTGATDAQGNLTGINFDQNTFQLNKVTPPAGAGGVSSATYQGDVAGTNCGAQTGEVCTQTNPNGNVTRYGYTAGNPTSITPPAPLGARSFSYDAAGRVLTATDGRGNTAHYSYDGNDRITQVSYAATGCPTATCVAYHFDHAGNLSSRTSPTGSTGFGYDPLNRPTTKTQGGALVSTALYDGVGNLKTYTDSSGAVTTYGYDYANRLVTLAEPGGSCPTYPTAPTFPNSTKCTGFGYDNANKRTTQTFPTGQKVTIGYDNASRVKAITSATSGGTTLASRSYTYQSGTGGGDQAVVKTMVDQNGTTSYGYDPLNRLHTAQLGATTTTYNYDNNGNRTSVAKTGSPTVYAAYNTADQECWSGTTSGTNCAAPPAGSTRYTFDGTGNQTGDTSSAGGLTNAFTVFNQLTSTTLCGCTTINYTYTDTTNTDRLTAGATNYLNGSLGVTGQTTSGTVISFIRDPYGNLVAMHTGGASYYYTLDQQGSVIALTDSGQAVAAAYSYDPWGNQLTATGTKAATNPYRYATGYYDTATGYLKLGARYYNPTTGRFTQPDPNTTWGNYPYAADNPVNNSDPTGRDWTDLLWGSLEEVGGVLGVGASAVIVAATCWNPFDAAGCSGGIELGLGSLTLFGVGYDTVGDYFDE